MGVVSCPLATINIFHFIIPCLNLDNLNLGLKNDGWNTKPCSNDEGLQFTGQLEWHLFSFCSYFSPPAYPLNKRKIDSWIRGWFSGPDFCHRPWAWEVGDRFPPLPESLSPDSACSVEPLSCKAMPFNFKLWHLAWFYFTINKPSPHFACLPQVRHSSIIVLNLTKQEQIVTLSYILKSRLILGRRESFFGILFDRLLLGRTVFHKELKSYIKCIVLYVSHWRPMKAVGRAQIPLQIDLL